MLATFMVVLDSSVANVALPHIAGTLSALDRRIDLGADQLPGGECDHAAGGGMDYAAHRTQAAADDLDPGVYRRVAAVRRGREHADAYYGGCCKGIGGGGMQPLGAVDSAGELSRPSNKARQWLFYGMGIVCCAGHRADAGRVDHRQLFLALDLLHQSPGGPAGDVHDEPLH